MLRPVQDEMLHLPSSWIQDARTRSGVGFLEFIEPRILENRGNSLLGMIDAARTVRTAKSFGPRKVLASSQVSIVWNATASCAASANTESPATLLRKQSSGPVNSPAFNRTAL